MNAPQEKTSGLAQSQAERQAEGIQAIRQNNWHYVLTVVRAALEDLVSARKSVELEAKQQALKETGQETLAAYWTRHRSEMYQRQVERSLRWISGSLEEVLTAAQRDLDRQMDGRDGRDSSTKRG